jgi:hypothetical protein
MFQLIASLAINLQAEKHAGGWSDAVIKIFFRRLGSRPASTALVSYRHLPEQAINGKRNRTLIESHPFFTRPRKCGVTL